MNELFSAIFKPKAHRASCFGCHTAAAVASLLVGSDSSSVSLEECQVWGRDTGSFFLQNNTLHHHVFHKAACFVTSGRIVQSATV